MNLRCLFGHRLTSVEPLYTRCVWCDAAFFTDYFASVEQGRTVRIRVRNPEELKQLRGYCPETGGWVR